MSTLEKQSAIKRKINYHEANSINYTNNMKRCTPDVDVFLNLLKSAHRTSNSKDGKCFVPASLVNGRRTKGSVTSYSAIVFDIDCGQRIEEIRPRLDALNIQRAEYSTYSHMSKATVVPISKLKSYADEVEYHWPPELTDLDESFLRGWCAQDEKMSAHSYAGFEPDRVEVQTSKGIAAGITIKHDAIEKYRIVIPFAEDFRLIDHGDDQSQYTLIWVSLYRAIAKDIGLKHDAAGETISQAMYFPSCPPDMIEHAFTHVRDGDDGCVLLDWRDYMDKREPVAVEVPLKKTTRDRKKTAKPEPTQKIVHSSHCIEIDKRLFAWKSAGHLDTFDWVAAAEEVGVAPFTGATTGDGEGVCIDCPFEHDGPSNDTKTAVYGPPLAIKCMGGTCSGKGGEFDTVDKLAFLQLSLDNGWINWEQLEDPTFGGGKIKGQPKNKEPTMVDVGRERAEESGLELLLWGEDVPELQADICAAKLAQRNAEEPCLFSFGGKLVRVEVDPDTGRAKVETITDSDLQDDIGRHAAIWMQQMKSGYKYIPTPSTMAKFVRRRLLKSVPKLERIVETPFYDGEWNLVAEPGYHVKSRSFYAPRHELTVALPPEKPGPNEVAKAVEWLREPFLDMPFDDDCTATIKVRTQRQSR